LTNYFPELNSQELGILLTPFDLKRLESYANNMLDYHVILDLLPTIGSLFFQRRLGEEVRLTPVQSSILLALGMQRKTIEDVEVCLKFFASLLFLCVKLTSL
jgi:N-acetyltransferase 10